VDVHDPGRVFDDRQLAIRAQGRRIGGLGELHHSSERARTADPATSVLLRPAPGTRYIDTANRVNECLGAGATDIVLLGASADS